jgi:hypothetical protein
MIMLWFIGYICVHIISETSPRAYEHWLWVYLATIGADIIYRFFKFRGGCNHDCNCENSVLPEDMHGVSKEYNGRLLCLPVSSVHVQTRGNVSIQSTSGSKEKDEGQGGPTETKPENLKSGSRRNVYE